MWHATSLIVMPYRSFLLTHPVWDVTRRFACFDINLVFLLTHPVWDVTITNGTNNDWANISTHTSRVGCDLQTSIKGPQGENFYSHIPCGMWHQFAIIGSYVINFYSHIPCGMWQLSIVSFDAFRAFLLTHPVWDVTPSLSLTFMSLKISTHTSRVGCDNYLRNL